MCPRCRTRFVSRNLWHSCGHFTLRGFLKGKPKRGIELFRYFLREYRKIGPIRLHPVKTRVAFMVEVRFSGVSTIGKSFVTGSLVLTERHPSRKFFRIEFIPPRYYLHHFSLSDESEIDSEFRTVMKMAYAVGERKHLNS